MKMKYFGLWAAIACWTLQSTSAFAQSERDIVVTAPRLEEAAREFSRAVSEPPSREDQLARFESRICPGVVGLGRRQAQFLVDRIAQRASDVDLVVGRTGCLANVLVLVTTDADSLARTVAEEQRYLMANYAVQENLSTRGSAALVDFVGTPRPIRWWHVSQTQTADGEILGHTNPYGRMESLFGQDFRGVEVARVPPLGFGRLGRPTLQAFRNVVIIVDAERVGTVQLSEIADYVAMVALAQLDPDADTTGYDTILNLFAEAPGERAGMTPWDIAYLRGLYAGHGNQVNSSQQIRNVARRMRDEMGTTPD